MARYFFNIFDGQDYFDRVGTELPTTRDVRRHMFKYALEFLENNENREPVSWQMEAVHEDGKIVSTMDFGIGNDNSPLRN